MSAYGKLLIKHPKTLDWLNNLTSGGVRVRHQRDDGTLAWIKLTAENTRIRNPAHDPHKHDANDPQFPLWLKPI